MNNNPNNDPSKVKLTDDELLAVFRDRRAELGKELDIDPAKLVNINFKKQGGHITRITFIITSDASQVLLAIKGFGLEKTNMLMKSDPEENALVFSNAISFLHELKILYPTEQHRHPLLVFSKKQASATFTLAHAQMLFEIYSVANGYINPLTRAIRKKETASKDLVLKRKSIQDAIGDLRGMGLTVFDEGGELTWDDLGGCEKQKQEIKKILINRIEKSHIYEAILRKTRRCPNPRMPKGILLYGPGGVGKTLTARIIASNLGVPVVCFKKSQVGSKWVNVSNENITRIFNNCKAIGRVILFIDELEQIGRKRGTSGNVHNDDDLATLLQEIDGVESTEGIILLGSTNMKDLIDAPLLQRFTAHIEFTNPDFESRKAIIRIYAQHLCENDVEVLARATDKMPGRAIEYCCEAAESSILEAIPHDADHDEIPLPSLQDYINEVRNRQSSGTKVATVGFNARDNTQYH